MKIIKYVPLLALLLLTNCATPSTPVEPAEQPKPLAIDPAICAYSMEEPILEGAIPKAQNEEEAEGIRLFLGYVVSVLDFAREADRIAKRSKEQCNNRVSGEPDHADTNTD